MRKLPRTFPPLPACPAAVPLAIVAVLAAPLAPALAAAAQPTPAERAAASMLAGFRPPPGAIHLDTPAVSSLATAPEHPAGNLVTRTTFWRAAGRPLDVLGWIQAHQPPAVTLTGGGETSAAHGVVFDFAEFTAPPTGLLSGRTLLVSVAADGRETAIRADAQVTWLPPRPSAERIPAGARVLTVAYLPGSGPVDEITDPAVIARIVAVADGLPAADPGYVSCPADFGREVQLTFRAAPDTPPLAVLTAHLGGCGPVSVTIGGRVLPALGDAARLADALPGKVRSADALPGRSLSGGRLMH